jgi:choline transport protein
MTQIPKGYAIEGKNSEREDDGFELRSHLKLGGTETDEHDMRMLGRTQQLNVRINHINKGPIALISN